MRRRYYSSDPVEQSLNDYLDNQMDDEEEQLFEAAQEAEQEAALEARQAEEGSHIGEEPRHG